MSGVQKLTVDQGEDGSRLDRWFKRRFPHIGQGLIQKLCRKGDIRVDGRRAKTDLRVEMGMEIRVPPLPEPGEVEKIDVLTPEEIHYVRDLVIYEDDELIAFNKPSGLAVRGGSKTTKHLDRLLDAFGEGMSRPRLVHRLDKDTSGVLVVGRTPKAAARLAKAFQQHRTKKTYWAIAIGVPKPRMGEIKGFLKKAAGAGGDPDRELMVGASHGDPGSHHALTRYTVVADAGQKASWVALRPVTGRTHQLRVHLAAMGTAILGDRKYTCHRPAPEDLGQRLCLHARRLEIPRENGAPLVIEADLPKPLAKVFNALGFNPHEIDEADIEAQLALMPDLKLAIWDIDGTLVDSRVVIQQAMERAFRRAGLGEISYERTRTIVGLELTEAVSRLAPADYPAERMPQLATFYKQAFIEMRTEPDFSEPLYDGAREMLEKLRDEGWLLGVATGKPRRGLDSVFEHHGLHRYFDTFQTVDHGPGKPHPRMVLDAMKETGAEAHRAVMIGDTGFDMAMGRNAGVHTLGVSWGFHTPDEITEGGAHELHHDFDTLGAALDAFAARG